MRSLAAKETSSLCVVVSEVVSGREAIGEAGEDVRYLV